MSSTTQAEPKTLRDQLKRPAVLKYLFTCGIPHLEQGFILLGLFNKISYLFIILVVYKGKKIRFIYNRKKGMLLEKICWLCSS